MTEAERNKNKMDRAQTKGIRYNLFFGIFNQLVIFALGILVPRLILVSYGSEANGLLSAVTQIFTYVALLEAGIGNASVNALYKPIAQKDFYGISHVFSATKKYYRKVTAFYFLCVVVLAAVYPLLANSELSYSTICLVVLFQGLSGAITFYFAAAYKQLLIADGKNYIVSNINLIVYILTSAAKIILMLWGLDIVAVQFFYLIIHCLQVAGYIWWVKRKYPWLKEQKDPSMQVLSQRNAFLVHEASGVVFSSTDVTVLSAFCNLKVASVYAVYNMVFVALNSLINSVNGGLNYLLGHTYAKDREKYVKLHDAYDSLYMAMVFSLISVAYVLMLPFVRLYTADITDIAYVDVWLPVLFVLVQLLSCGRAVSARLITIAGHAKATQWRSAAEAVINLVSSIILVQWLGIYGVLLGTIIALLYRCNDIIIYANKKILHRSPMKTYGKLFANFLIFGGIVLLEQMMKERLFQIDSYLTFGVAGIVCTVISVVLYFGIAIIVDRDILMLLKRFLHKK